MPAMQSLITNPPQNHYYSCRIIQLNTLENTWSLLWWYYYDDLSISPHPSFLSTFTTCLTSCDVVFLKCFKSVIHIRDWVKFKHLLDVGYVFGLVYSEQHGLRMEMESLKNTQLLWSQTSPKWDPLFLVPSSEFFESFILNGSLCNTIPSSSNWKHLLVCHNTGSIKRDKAPK